MNNEEVAMINMLSNVVDKIKDWIIISNLEGKIIYVNQVVYRDTMSKEEEIIGANFCDFLGMNLSGGDTAHYMNSLVNKNQKIEFITSRTIMGNKRTYLANTLNCIWDDNNKRYYVCLSKDISVILKLKEEAYRAGNIDALTNYPNQNQLFEKLSSQLKKSTKLALILLDMSSLEEANVYYGVHIGEIIIKTVGERLKAELSSNQEIYKFSSNVFAILYNDVEDKEEIDDFLMRVNQSVEEPVQIQNRYFYVTFQASVVFYPYEQIDSNQLIEKALLALEYSKRQRGSKHAVTTYYSPVIEEEAQKIDKEEKDLQQAVDNNEFIVYYQPIINLKDNKLIGLEALIRRRTSSGQIIAPGLFISTLEHMHLIEYVGNVVLEKVCIQLREWLDKGYDIVPISVNLSALQFRNLHLADNIKAMLEKYHIMPDYIVLEVTEGILIENISTTQEIIDALRDYGISISIDDFGTGYASIGYLKQFMCEHLKIDMSFIKEIVKNKSDRIIVEAIIAIAKTLNLTTIAEGIESQEQLNVVSSLGCEWGQGYFWNSPATPEHIENKYFKKPIAVE